MGSGALAGCSTLTMIFLQQGAELLRAAGAELLRASTDE